MSLKHHLSSSFDNSINTCKKHISDITCTSLLDKISSIFDITSLQQDLRVKRNKRDCHEEQDWRFFTISVFSSTITKLYSTCILHSIMRLQFSILGRHNYYEIFRQNKKNIEKQDPYYSNYYFNRFIDGGIEELSKIIQEITSTVLDPFRLDSIITSSELINCFYQIHSQICNIIGINNIQENCKSLFLSNAFSGFTQSQENLNLNRKFFSLENEMNTLIQTRSFLSLLKLSLDTTFKYYTTLLLSEWHKSYPKTKTESSKETVPKNEKDDTDILYTNNCKSKPLVKLTPFILRISSLLLTSSKQGDSNVNLFIDTIFNISDFKQLSTIVFFAHPKPLVNTVL